MGEICNILNVEYVVQGLVSIEKSTVSNYGSTSKQSKSNKDLHVDKKPTRAITFTQKTTHLFGKPKMRIKLRLHFLQNVLRFINDNTEK